MTDFLVQHASSNNNKNSGTGSENTHHTHFPQPTSAGNYVRVVFHCSHTPGTVPTVVVTDDTSTTWQLLTTVTNAGDSNDATTYYYYRKNCPAGVFALSLAFSTAVSWVQDHVTEYWGIDQTSPFDGTPATHDGSAVFTTSWTGGSVTTTQANSLFDVVTVNTGGPIAATSGFAVDSGLALLATDLRFGVALAYGTKATAGALNPVITSPVSSNHVGITVALKTNINLGTPADTTTRPWIRRIIWVDVDTGGTTLNFQVPRSGSAIILPTAIALTAALTDNLGNTYTRKNTALSNNAGTVQFFYCLNPTVSFNTLFTLTAPAGDLSLTTAACMDIDYAGTLMFDTFTDNFGNQATAGNLTAGSITPSAAGGITLFQIQSDNSSFRELTNVSGYASQDWGDTYNGGENVAAQDAGVGHCFPTSTATLTPIWTDNPLEGVGDWTAGAISFIPAFYQKWGLESGTGAWSTEAGTGYWITEASAPAPSGSALVRVVNAQLSGTDVWIRRAIMLRLAPNTVNASEVRLRAARLLRVRSDTLDGSEVVKRTVSILRIAPNSAQLSESTRRPLAAVRQAPNTAQVSESRSRVGVWLRNAADQLHPSEVVRRVGTWVRRAADTTHALELANRVVARVRSVGDALHASESVSRGLQRVRVVLDALHASEVTARIVSRLVLVFANATLQASESTRRIAVMLRRAAETLHANEQVVRKAVLLRVTTSAINASEAIVRRVSVLRFAPATAQVSESARRIKVWAARVVADAIHALEQTNWLRTRLTVVFANATLQASEGARRVAALVRRATDAVHASELLQRRAVMIRQRVDAVHATESAPRVGVWHRVANSAASIGEAVLRRVTLAARVVSSVLHGSEQALMLFRPIIIVVVSSVLSGAEAVRRRVAIVRRASDSLHASEVLGRLVTHIRTASATLRGLEQVPRLQRLIRSSADTLQGLEFLYLQVHRKIASMVEAARVLTLAAENRVVTVLRLVAALVPLRSVMVKAEKRVVVVPERVDPPTG